MRARAMVAMTSLVIASTRVDGDFFADDRLRGGGYRQTDRLPIHPGG